MSKVIAYIEDKYLVIKKDSARNIDNNIQKIEISSMKTNQKYKSKIKITNISQQYSIILKEEIKFEKYIENFVEENQDLEHEIEHHGENNNNKEILKNIQIKEEKKLRIIVYINKNNVYYYKAYNNIYKGLVSVKQKVINIRLTKKKCNIFMVAFIKNPYDLPIEDSYFKLDENNTYKLKLNEYKVGKKVNKFKMLFNDLHIAKFKVKDVIENETRINNSCSIVLVINGEEVTFKTTKLSKKFKVKKMYYAPFKSRYIGDYAIHFRRTLFGNIIFVKRKKEAIEHTLRFRILESKFMMYFIKYISRFLKLFMKKKVNLFFEKFSSKAEEGAFDLFELFSKQNTSKNYFVINENCDDYKKIYNVKNVVKQFSFKYYFYIFLADNLITTEATMHVNILRSNNAVLRKEIYTKKNIFLQHGIIYLKCMNKNSAFTRGKEAEADYIIVSSKKEQEVAAELLNMPEEDILVTGLAIFSKIKPNHINSTSKDTVTIMLTWKPYEEHLEDFTKSSYYKNVTELYDRLSKYIDKKNINIVAHPRVNELLASTGMKIWDKPISEVLKQTKVMITDYSSICYNSFYQGSGVIFYQPDLELYEKENGKLIPNDDEFIGQRAFNIDEMENIFKESIVNKKIKLNKLRTKENEDMYKTINEFTDGKNIDRIYNELKRLNIV